MGRGKPSIWRTQFDALAYAKIAIGSWFGTTLLQDNSEVTQGLNDQWDTSESRDT